MMLTHRLLAFGKRCSSFAITIKFQSIFPIIPNANLAGRCRKSKSNRPICIGKITQIHQLSCASKHHYLYRYEHTSLGSQTYFKIHFKKEAKNDVICHHLFLVVLKNCYSYDVYTEIDASWNWQSSKNNRFQSSWSAHVYERGRQIWAAASALRAAANFFPTFLSHHQSCITTGQNLLSADKNSL